MTASAPADGDPAVTLYRPVGPARIEWVPLADVPGLVVKREIVSSSTITALMLSLHGRPPER